MSGACSFSGYRSSPMLSPYSVTKWSVRGLTQAAAMEWAKYRITVNVYCPGKQEGEGIKENSNKRIALGRTGVSEDVANFVSCLASKDSDYMTGKSIMMDGGIEFS